MSTRSNTKTKSDDDLLIQRVVERVITSEEFLAKLTSKISEAVNKTIQDTVKVYEVKVSELENKVAELEYTIDNQEQFSRRNNLRIYGLPEEKDENIQNKICTLAQEKFGVKLETYDFEFCYRLKGKEGNSRPVMVRFSRYQAKQEIYKSKSKLKGSKIVIKEDLTKRRVEVYKRACKSFELKNVWSSEGKVFCKVDNAVHKLATLQDLDELVKSRVIVDTL